MLIKKHKAIPFLKLLDESGQIIYESPLKEYRLPENVVLELSNEFYSDPEPCEIHRGAIHMRVYMELLEICPEGATKRISELDERVQSYFPFETTSIVITEKKK